ncbi:MAG TPA: cellulase N-terminal Ig-like domain-containing protein, partial [Flavisolibacter sp.]
MIQSRINKMITKSLLCLLTISATLTTQAQSVTPRIKLNQLGFYPSAPKLAVITGETTTTDFYITSTNLRDTIFTGTLSPEKQSANSATKTKIADFTALKTGGSFVVLIPQVGHSYVFTIT